MTSDNDGTPYLGDIARSNLGGNEQQDQDGKGPRDLLAALTILSSEQGETRAHLAELRDHLADVLEQLQGLQGRVDDFTALERRIITLTDAVDQLTAEAEEDESPQRPRDLVHIPPDERREALEELVIWVRDVVFVGWPWTRAKLARCWLLHPDLVNGVLWLRAAYAAAYETSRARPHHAADWHRWLEEVMRTAELRTRDCPTTDEEGLHAVPTEPRDDSRMIREMFRQQALLQMVHLSTRLREGADYPKDEVQAARDRWDALIAEWDLTEADFKQHLNARVRTQTAETGLPQQSGSGRAAAARPRSPGG
jgi:hypothetical protein